MEGHYNFQILLLAGLLTPQSHHQLVSPTGKLSICPVGDVVRSIVEDFSGTIPLDTRNVQSNVEGHHQNAALISVFMRSPACLSNPVSSHGSSSGEVRLDNVSANSLHEDRMKEQFLEDTLVKCSGSHRDENLDVPASEVESVIQDEALDLGSNRDGKRGKNNTLKVSESTQQESPVTDSNCITITPGSVVWAKTSCQVWWPAEIMEERPTLAGQTCDGHVLVQFYGNQPCAWIDPVKDLSAFEDSFEERSGNPAKDFQDALKQALQRKEQLISHSKSSP
ncbi:uncharacterized protein LOC114726991 [Neltuma alba]|uniref:uncharacterized protein LOC114726991 n=1 Tax=Neltuma alba TaxID=207710 RepID=UPI0010A34D65|nr:uncharacterized protein LOC114726991 [Prosopis alba]